MAKSKFTFVGHTHDLLEGKASFKFRIEHGEEVFDFEEKISFPKVEAEIPEELPKSLLDNLLLVLGTSYWKLYCPKEIDLGSIQLNKEQADFWNTIYAKGLGEFFYQNKIDFRGLIKFPVSKHVQNSTSFQRKDRSLVGLGGGKDSIVVCEFLKNAGKDFSIFIVNQHPIKEGVVEKLGAPQIIFKREFDPLLFELNDRKDTYNGHVPVSSHYAFFGLLACVLYDFSYFIVGNEESANYGNVEYLGETMNHQWSKSLEFELLFRDYVRKNITEDITYFSLLRPLKEIKITEIFSKYPQYFNSFSSCNGNFRITGEKQDVLWCGKCAKCLFVFSMLSAFLPKEQLIGIFGQNLFDDESLLSLFKELLGLEKFKPFECVGTPEEMKYAISLASRKGEFNDSKLMEFFNKEVRPQIDSQEIDDMMKTGSLETIPQEFKPIFKTI